MPKQKLPTIQVDRRDLAYLVELARAEVRIKEGMNLMLDATEVMADYKPLSKAASKCVKAMIDFRTAFMKRRDSIIFEIDDRFPKPPGPKEVSDRMRRIALARTSSRIYTKAIHKLVGGDLKRAAQRKVRASRTKR